MKTPTIMIAGSHGFVGARAMQHFPHAIALPSQAVRCAGKELTELIKAVHPDVILNAAAISDIGSCEKDPEGSYQANVMLPVVLAKVSRELGAKLISFSSDQVYTGCCGEGPYGESELLPPPANLYARHKLEAEERVLEIDPSAVLLRATWMYDLPMFGHANRSNFLVNTLGAAMQGREIEVSAREHRGITYVRQVVSFIDAVIGLSGGVYNYGSENPLTMPDTAKACLRAFGVDACVREIDRPRHNLWMDCSKLSAQGIRFDSTEEGFLRCAADYRLRV